MNEVLSRREKSVVAKKPAFLVRHRVELELDFDLALSLGDFLLRNHCENQAIVALAHQLSNLLPVETISEEDEDK